MQKKTQTQVMALTACVLLIFTFQNCSSGFEAGNDSSTLESSSGNVSDPFGPGPGAPSAPPVGRAETGKPIGVFVAQGHYGRTLMSCDDGRTWINDRSDDDSKRCWIGGDPNYVECDHQANAGRGLDIGDGWIYALFGWGYNGSLRRSRDGVRWETMRTNDWGGGVAYGLGRLMIGWNVKSISLDQGVSWQDAPGSPFTGFNYPILKRVGNKFIMHGRAAGPNIVGLSLDQGLTWTVPPSIQVGWIKSFAEGNGRLVAVGYSDATTTSPLQTYSAVSLDDGRTWSMTEQTTLVGIDWSGLVFDGNQFVTWAKGKRFVSADGVTWTSLAISKRSPDGVVSGFGSPGRVSFSPKTKTYVSLFYSFGLRYEAHRAYRSADGLLWDELPTTAYKGGHPVRELTYGEIDEAYCQ